jgi:DeoR/GlpR family transcriptional regulator of sugar metabolism
MKSERLSEIRRLLLLRGFASVAEIADATDASLATVRRDLDVLEGHGIVVRVHGGARLAEATTVEAAFETREEHHLAAKRAIAQAALSEVAAHSNNFFDAGTTLLQLARALRVAPVPCNVCTNGLPVAQALLDVPGVGISMLGGRLRGENMSIVGPTAEQMLENLWFDTLFLGAGAIAPDCRIYGLDEAEAHLNARMIARAGRVVLLADASKFGRMANYAIAPLDHRFTVVTDKTLVAGWLDRLRERGLTVRSVAAAVQ